MTPRSLRARSIVAAAVAVLLALVVVGVAVDVLVARRLHTSLDHSLRQRAVEVAQLSASAPALLTSPGALDAPLGGEQLTVEVIDRRGRLLARSLALGGRVLPVGGAVHAVIAHGVGRYLDTRLGSDHLRVYIAPLAAVGGPASGGAVAVAGSTHDLSATVGSVRLFVVVAALVAAGIAALALAVLMRRALSPLGQLAASASEIEQTGDLRRRLPEPTTDDEVGRLAGTLNAMLTSLEASREAERRFLADASHELRTPLTALLGNVSYLARHGADPELVRDLEHDAARLGLLADDLLTLSREEATSLPEDIVHLDDLVRTAAAEDPSVDVIAPDRVSVRGDRAALERALANLVENAHRHGPAGGRVAVEAVGADGKAILSVTDEGPGLQPYEARKAFDRFWRGRRTDAPGSGLGLAIVRATAERHGGHAYVAGPKFSIELPALRDLSELGGTTGEQDPRKGTP